ncbi:MAG: hypothetical protein K2N84_04525, partial [Clostridia bacterium]|nr:hypothetical protein [Clostridia bacterium]
HTVNGKNNDQGLKYGANVIVNKTISVENGKIVYDLATTGTCDIVIYVTEGPDGENGTGSNGHYVYFTNFNGLAEGNFNGKGVITGAQLLAAVKAKSDSKGWGYTGNETELTIKEFRVRIGDGSVLTIKTLGIDDGVTD